MDRCRSFEENLLCELQESHREDPEREREREREREAMALVYTLLCTPPPSTKPTSSFSSLNLWTCKHSVAFRPGESPGCSLSVESGRPLKPSVGSPRMSCAASRLHLLVSASAKLDPLKVMISGPPASGKGTQCELIKAKYGLVHIAAGDLLRAEIDAGTEYGKRAKEYMEKGELVPNEIVVSMVKNRLLQPDAQENGWLLDGYPRSSSQASALEELGIRPDLFILIIVNEESLVERVVGRRVDPISGKSYHLKFSPPENEEISARLIQRFDDTAEKILLRLKTYHENLQNVISFYEDVLFQVDGNISIDGVFVQVDKVLSAMIEKKSKIEAALRSTTIAP